MTQQQAEQAVKRVAEYTIDFLARKHAVSHEDVAASLLAGDKNLVDQWQICFRLACDLVS